jgi:hypothetical protein
LVGQGNDRHLIGLLLALCLLPTAALAQIATGSYVGDGADPRPITGVGFRPDVVIVKVDYDNATDDTCSAGVIRTSTMTGDASKLMAGVPLLGPPCPSPSTGLIPNLVQSLDSNGFTVGNDDRVNGAPAACGGANCTYYWVAFKANANLRLATYTGSGGSQSITGLGFSPEYVMVLPANNNKAQHRTPAGGARSDRFDAGGATTTGITSLGADGFTVTSAAAPDNLNASGVIYHYAAWNAVPGSTVVSRYKGNGSDNRTILLPGFRPSYLIVQSFTDATGRDAFQRTASMVGDASLSFRDNLTVNRIQALQPLGFEVGTDVRVNAGGDSYAFVAFGDSPDSPCSTGGSWWNPDWGRRRRIVFNNSGQPDNLVDFPVLIRLDSSRIDYARTQNAGQDLRFVDADDQTVLAHEIERWDEAGASYVWVRVPRIDASSAGDYIYMYYENASVPDGQNPTAVWSNGYQGVWHLKENPAAPPPQFQDSTANNNDGTAVNSPVQAAGQIDGSLSFDGTSDRRAEVPSGASLQFPANMTVSGWARTSSADAQSRPVVARWNLAGSSRNYWLGKLDTTTFSFYVDSTENVGISLSLVNDDQWHHVVGVADASAGLLRLYLDGTERATAAYDGASQTGTSVLQIGNNPDSTGQNWDGGIDEVRVANVARSAAWIRAQYLSTSDRFVSFGAEVGACQLRSIGTALPYADGTVTVTTGSWRVTGSGTAWKTNNRGRGDRITIDGTDYTVLAVGSDTELRLSSVFTGTGGSGKAYTIARKFMTLADWEDCVDGGAGTCAPFSDVTGSLVADNRQEIGIAYKDSVFNLTATVTIRNSTTDSTHDITLTADAGNRHLGIAGNGVVVDNSLNCCSAFEIFDAFVTVQWLEIRSDGAGGTRAFHLASPIPASNKLVVRNNLIHNIPSFAMQFFDAWTADVYNNIIHDANRGIQLDVAAATRIFNNTIYNCNVIAPGGINSSAGANPNMIMVNNIAHSNAGSQYGVAGLNAGSSNNLASDATGTTHSPAGGGINSVPLPNMNFVSTTPGSENLHITGGSAAEDVGEDLSMAFTIDIDDAVRSVLWDMGADDLSAVTAVVLESFGARGLDSAVELRWQTASELRNLGFHLHRARSESGPYERITSSLIPGLGSSPVGTSYSYTDPGLANGLMYFYKLEDVDTSGATTLHGPVSAAPTPGDSDDDEGMPDPTPSDPGHVAYGDPSDVSLEVLERDARYVLLELRTGGFFATPNEDGSVDLEIPSFEDGARPGQPRVPTRRAWVEAVAGRKARIASVQGLDAVSFPGLRPSPASAPTVEVTREGIVRPGRVPRPEDASFLSRAFPRIPARLRGTAFQGETKKVELELAPLRFLPSPDRLVLARRLLVRLEFVGREKGEIALGGARGRRPPVPRPRPDPGSLVQLRVREKGLYRVSFEEAFPGRRAAVYLASLSLSRQGQGVAFFVDASSFGPGSSLYFLSEGASLNPDAQEAVYELAVKTGGPRMSVASAAPSGPPTSFYWQRLLVEENKTYQAGLLEAPDLWLWQALVSPVTRSYPFTIDSLAATSAPAHLTVWLQGASDFEADPDHHLRISVNGTPLAEASWDGQAPRTIEAEVTPGLLLEGQNTLEIENVGDTAAAYSMVLLDKFSLLYPRATFATGGVLEGSFTESGTVEATGLGPDAILLDTTETTPRWLDGMAPGTGTLSFRAEIGRRYVAVDASALKKPSVRFPPRSGLRSPENQADYLLVAARGFLPAAAPLLALRQGQGLKTRAVAIEDVFDAFGFGEEGPEALKAFLAYAYHSWKRPSPRYVLLLGDATYDPKDHLRTGIKNRVPPLVARTTYLWTASDPGYAAVNGEDLLPDLALGRLSAATVEEARALVEKVVAFETAGRDLSGPAVLVADNPDLAGDFEANADDLAATVLAGRNVEKVFLSEKGPSTRAEIARALDQGASILSYVGHGSIAVWASENVWNNLDVNALAPQPQQPVLFTMNCLNGFFHFPPLNSLAEQFVKAEGKGAVAAVSPSGLSLDAPAHLLHKALLTEILSGRHPRLGDALLAAQGAYADTGAFPELLTIYHLFGDPAMSLR